MVRGRVIPMKDITDTYIPTAAEQRRAAKKKSREMIAQLKELYRLTKVTKVTKGKKSFMDKEIIGRFNEIVSPNGTFLLCLRRGHFCFVMTLSL